MREFVFGANCPLHEYFGEKASHEGVKVGKHLATGKIMASEESKGHNDFQESLLVVHVVTDAVEGRQFFEEQTGRLPPEELILRSGPGEVFVDEAGWMEEYCSSSKCRFLSHLR